MSPEDKEKLAYEFAERYKGNMNGFLKFLKESDFSVCTNYKDSWDFVAEELHSLERHTNVGLCFK